MPPYPTRRLSTKQGDQILNQRYERNNRLTSTTTGREAQIAAIPFAVFR
jgi:hypothetical protein